MEATENKKILAFATKGHGSNEEERILSLLSKQSVDIFVFDAKNKVFSALALFQKIKSTSYALVVMEGSGMAGGIVLLVSKLFFQTRYIVSSGDAIAPFLCRRLPLVAPIFYLYEFLLYHFSAGFIGWTPYLAGRALAAGAPRAMSAAGWSDLQFPDDYHSARIAARNKLEIPLDAPVFALVGALDWNPQVGYCYGLELLEALIIAPDSKAHILIMGSGTGLARMRAMVPISLEKRVHFTGKVDRKQLAELLNAADFASLPQSTDAIGSYRYTTKLSEYLSSGLPIITNQIPLAYDLGIKNLYRLPGDSPWDKLFIRALAQLFQTLTPRENPAPIVEALSIIFDKKTQIDRVQEFIQDILRR